MKYYTTQARFHSDLYTQSEWVTQSGHATLEEAKKHIEFCLSSPGPVDYRIVNPKGKEVAAWLKEYIS